MDRAEALGAERVPLRAETVPGRGSDTVPVRASDILPQPANSEAVSQPVNSQPPTDDEHLDRVFTVPNLITMVRLACIPLFLWLLFGAHRQTLAAVLLGVLGATDWVDGHVARRFHQVSTLGKVLDPVADRVLVGTSVISIIVYGAVPVWFGVATIAREVVVSVAVLALASLGAKRIDVLWVGKAGTFALMFSYPAFLLSYGSAQWQTPFHVFAWVSGIIGLVLAWIAAGSYIPVARQALADGRRARAASDPVAANSSDAPNPIEGANVAGPGSEVTR